MQSNKTKCEYLQSIYLADADKESLSVISQTLKYLGVNIVTFECANQCIKHLAKSHCDLLITEVKMPTMSGLKLLNQAKKASPWLPVILISDHSDVSMAVDAMKLGASDFLTKPIERNTLINSVKILLAKSNGTNRLLGNTLTKTERYVLPFIVEGQSNQSIANKVHRSVRTIEHHRQHIMNKLNVSNLAELVIHLQSIGLIQNNSFNSSNDKVKP